ncbi:CHAT domain-containing protein [Desulfobacterales bacterium HSG2]|nr:CHAT domain-containing protein [Desulfobacterales bacterium HSG2]MDM8548539.1 CHAT domain-containing protein [Desulfobacterales bacterium HSG2]
MKNGIKLIAMILLSISLVVPIQAQITLDGTIGSVGESHLQGPDYDIRAEYGKQAGANLFHSFQQFSIHTGESATFTGPDSVRNIISRVTGGEASLIDGRLASAIPDADLYFLNPAGVMFGPNASLDLGGSFRVSTADYLRLGGNERFYAIPHANDVLSVAAPAAFGFLDSDVAPIRAEGRGEITEQDWENHPTGLRVSEGKNIMLAGGDIRIGNGTRYTAVVRDESGEPVLDGEGNPVTDTEYPGELKSPAGQISLCAVRSAGEVRFTETDPVLTDFTRAGDVTLSGNALLDASGRGGGRIFIRGGNIVAETGHIRSETLGDRDGLGINIGCENLLMNDGSRIITSSRDSGRGGDISVRADTVELKGKNPIHLSKSEITTITDSIEPDAGTGGKIQIDAEEILLEDGGVVYTNSEGSGNGGDITVRAGKHIRLSGNNAFGEGSFISCQSKASGRSGDVSVETGDLEMRDGGQIFSVTAGSGDSGNVTVNAGGKVAMEGTAASGLPSLIRADTFNATGDAGNVTVNAGELVLTGGASIYSGTSALDADLRSGNAGDITVHVEGDAVLSGVNPHGMTVNIGSGVHTGSLSSGTGKPGDTGNITLTARNLTIRDGAKISSGSAGGNAPVSGGDIDILVQDTMTVSGDSAHIEMLEPGVYQLWWMTLISTELYDKSVSGVYIHSKNRIGLSDYSGNIRIQADRLVLSKGGTISTETWGGGNAENIDLRVGRLEMESGAVISSRSTRINAHEISDSRGWDSRFLVRGDIVQISDAESGRSADYIYTGEALFLFLANNTVADMEALEALPGQQIVPEGAVVSVSDAGNGEVARFMRVSIEGHKRWAPYNPDQMITMADMSELDSLPYQIYSKLGEDIPSAARDRVIEVTDAGGKPAQFFCTYAERHDAPGVYRIRVIRIMDFEVTGTDELTTLSERYDLKNGTIANISEANISEDENMNTRVLYADGEWIPFGSMHQTDDMNTMNALIQTKTGDVVHKADDSTVSPSALICSGKEWLPLGQTFTVSDTADADSLDARAGDVVRISDGDDDMQYSVYDGSGWIPFETAGRAGTVAIRAGTVRVTGKSSISTATSGSGSGGGIDIEAGDIRIGSDSSVTTDSDSTDFGGPAGKIRLAAGNIVELTDGAALRAEARSGGGGQISADADNRIYLLNASATSNVSRGESNGGDVSLSAESVLLNHAGVSANADEGDGGAVFIAAENFVRSSDSSVTATSRRGNEGTVRIEAPDADISGTLSVMPGTYLDAAKWAKTPCEQRSAEKRSRFEIRGRDAVPTPLDDLQPSPVFPDPYSEEDKFFRKGDFSGAVRLLEGRTNLQDTGKEKLIFQEKPAYHAALLSHAYLALGYHRKALAILRETLPDAENRCGSSGMAILLSSLGDVHLCLGNRLEATKYLKKALDHARRTGNPLLISGVLNNLGNFRSNMDYRRSLAAYREYLPYLGDSEAALSLKSKILLNTACTEMTKGKHQNAVVTLKQAAEVIGRQPETYGKAADLISLSMLAAETSEAGTEGWLRAAARIGEDIRNNRIASYAYGCLGQYYEKKERYDDAVRLTRKAIFSAQQGYFPEILYRWQRQSGRLFAKQGDIRRGIESYQRAVATLNPIRTEFFTGFRGLKDIFDKDVRPVYSELAELLLRAADTSETSHILIREAWDTVEFLKKAELENFFRDECLNDLDRTGIWGNISPGTAVICPILMPDHLYLMLMLPDRLTQIRIPVSAGQLCSTAKRFRELLEEKADDFQEEAVRLYNWLIRPAESEFASRSIDTLIIVPDGPLSLLPFSALHDGEHFLVEKYALGTIPSLSLTDIGQTLEESGRTLICGISEAKEGFSPLMEVERELEAVRAATDGKILMNRDFTTERLRAEITNQNYGILHIASHAVFGSTSRDTFLVTYDGILTMDGLEELVGLRRYRREVPELLTLSACETATGDARAAFGLAGAALKAGAKSVLATLWPVSDEAAFLTMREFYRQIGQPGISKAEALRNAQKKLISESEYDHPAFWAPFLLIGNWL